MLKILLILIILFLLRDKLTLLKPHWHTLAQIHRGIGLSPALFTLISSMLGAGLAASRGRQFLRRLFPSDGKDGNDVSR